MIRLIDTVKQQTNGELLINLHLGGSLPIKATNITAAVADNVVQIGDDGFATGTISDQRHPAPAVAAAERCRIGEGDGNPAAASGPAPTARGASWCSASTPIRSR